MKIKKGLEAHTIFDLQNLITHHILTQNSSFNVEKIVSLVCQDLMPVENNDIIHKITLNTDLIQSQVIETIKIFIAQGELGASADFRKIYKR